MGFDPTSYALAKKGLKKPDSREAIRDFFAPPFWDNIPDKPPLIKSNSVRNLFISTSEPNPESVGDLWIRGEVWPYRQAITISNSNSEDLTDFQVKLELNANNVGEHFDWSRQGADLRFYTADGQKIPYWVESWDETNKQAVIWVKVPSIPTGGSTTIYMYYGNPSAASESNGEAVFEFFDDFEGTSLDTSKWNAETNSGTVTVSDGTVILDTGSDEGFANIKSVRDFSSSLPILIEVRMQVSSVYDGKNDNRIRGFTPHCPHDVGIFDNSAHNDIQVFWNDYTGIKFPLDVYVIGKHIWKSDSVTWAWYKEDRSSIYSNSYTPSTSPDFISVSVGDGDGTKWGKIIIDWVRVRKYAEQEPSAQFGAEEEASLIDAISPRLWNGSEWVGNIEARSIYPEVDNTYNCGSPASRWKNIYAVNVQTGDVVFQNGWRITEFDENGKLMDGLRVLNKGGAEILRITEDGLYFKGKKIGGGE